MNRRTALETILAAFPQEPFVVTLGSTSREMIDLGERENHLHLLDSMGLPPAVGLGVALGLADRYDGKVIVLEGDGGLLMGLSTLSTIGFLKPSNLLLLVLDNGTYGATGGQDNASATTDFCLVAQACGIEAHDVGDPDALKTALDRAKAANGPVMLRIRIDQTYRTLPYYVADPAVLTDRFGRYLAAIQGN